jgi:hypothetical protein
LQYTDALFEVSKQPQNKTAAPKMLEVKNYWWEEKLPMDSNEE